MRESANVHVPLPETRTGRPHDAGGSSEQYISISDAQIARGLDYAQRRTPGVWNYTERGAIMAVPHCATDDGPSYYVASVSERYTNETTNFDASYIVEAVNNYELALEEVRSIRERERASGPQTDHDLRRQLRRLISQANADGKTIDPRDLLALADMPLVTIGEHHATRCATCGHLHAEAIETRNVEVSGPVVICECAIKRPAHLLSERMALPDRT